MFDAMTFVRKNAKSLSTPVVAHGFKMKLNGWADDTVEGLAQLAKKQTEDVRVSLPKVQITEDVQRGAKSATLSPTHTAILITGQEQEEEKPTPKQKNRGGIDPVVTANGSTK